MTTGILNVIAARPSGILYPFPLKEEVTDLLCL